MSGHRSTSAAVVARVDIVYRLVLLGLDRQRIIDHVRKKYPKWPHSTASIDRYIARARQIMMECAEPMRPEEFAKALARYDDLYSVARTAKNVEGCLKVQHQRNKLLGLYPARRVKVSIEDLATSEIEAEIARLEALFVASPDT